MKYLNHDGTYKTFVCGRCRAEIVFTDERNDEGVGTVWSTCPNCPDVSGFSFYGGEVDLGIVRESVVTDRDFQVFP